MQERHKNRKNYFEEQSQTSRKYYIPYIESTAGQLPEKVLEVGCGEGGNLLPFAEAGCKVVGVDIADSRIRQAQTFFSDNKQDGTFIASDIFCLKSLDKTFSLILIHDVIEHIQDKRHFLSGLKEYLSPDGVVFIAFPAWQMPFGGHQQIARKRTVSHLPFIHLIPYTFYKWFLKLCGETEDIVKELLSIKKTRCSIEIFKKAARESGYNIISEQLYLINPHYDIKFGLQPRKLNKAISRIPYLRNFFSTSCFYCLKSKTEK